MPKYYDLLPDVADAIAVTLQAERLKLRLTQRAMALRLTIAPQMLDKFERREVRRAMSEDVTALKTYFGDRLPIHKV